MIIRHNTLRRLLRRGLSTSSPLTPATGFSNLTPTRRLLQIHGHDASKFLQGITTANFNVLTHGGAYTAFLTAQGRVVFDAFAYVANTSPTWLAANPTASSDDPAFLVEADASQLPALLSHIKRYKLRSKLSFRAVDPEEWTVWSTWGPTPPPYEIGCPDSRAPDFGHRAVLPSSTAVGEASSEVSARAYQLRRILAGLPEGAAEIVPGTALPLESNIDIMGGIDFRKGCYVGQELTIRTKHTGVVRKRILPVAFYGEGESAPETLEEASADGESPPGGAPIKAFGKRGRPVGKWLDGVGRVGFAVCRLETMAGVVLGGEEEGVGLSDGDEFAATWMAEGSGEEKSVKVKAFVPEWFPLERR